MSKIVRGERSITANTALLLSTLFGTTAEFWLRLQESYNLANARTHIGLNDVQPLTQSA